MLKSEGRKSRKSARGPDMREVLINHVTIQRALKDQAKT